MLFLKSGFRLFCRFLCHGRDNFHVIVLFRVPKSGARHPGRQERTRSHVWAEALMPAHTRGNITQPVCARLFFTAAQHIGDIIFEIRMFAIHVLSPLRIQFNNHCGCCAVRFNCHRQRSLRRVEAPYLICIATYIRCAVAPVRWAGE